MVNTHSIGRLFEQAPYIINPNGHITIIGSSASTMGRDNFGYYSASKVATNSLVQAKAQELIKQNIYINCLCPSKTKTKMVDITKTSEDTSLFLDPKDVAKAAINTLLIKDYGQIWYIYKGLETVQ